MRSHNVPKPLVLAVALTLTTAAWNTFGAGVALGASASELDRAATQALRKLYRDTPGAKELGEKAVGVLIFPSIKKGGLIIGGQFGDGVLRKGNKTVGYYRSLAASYGLQAGGQAFSYVLFFMDDASLQYLDKSDGWEVGTGPSLVVLDKGFGKSMTTTTLKSGVYAYIFGQKGAMAGLGIQGSKITKINPGS
ncbi:MAG TPA: lipid-binding SYLF domain-containing protein [Candidatus Margulisiibacteriota bacterium]|nr:lipid-binding SYLF domain-containing protein [Candidatus Margulisiibacteriota bacterium]